MQTRRGQVGVWIFLAFLVLFIGVVLLFIFLHGRETSSPSSQLNMSNQTFFNVSIVFVNVSGLPVSYVLSNISFDVRGGFVGDSCVNVSPFLLQGFVFNGSDLMGCPIVGRWVRGGVLVKGLFFPDSLEFFRGGVLENSTVLLEGFSDSYYFNSTVCNVSSELFSCRLGLMEKASDFSVSFNDSVLIVNITDGTLQKPKMCFAWNYALSNILVNLTASSIPVDLHWKYDSCFDFGRDLSNITFVPLTFHYNPFFNVSVNVSVLIRDFERPSYRNVGDRYAQIR